MHVIASENANIQSNIVNFVTIETEYMIKSAKRDYFDSKIDESKGNPESLWKTLKLLGHFAKNKFTCKIGLKIEDEVCFNEKTCLLTTSLPLWLRSC